MKDNCLLFFLRRPCLGLVKTRLARDVGDELALGLYQAMVLDMLEVLDGLGVDVALWVSPGHEVGQMADWLGRHRLYLPQPEGDLGARLHAAFAWAYGQGYTKVAALGSDLPQVSPDIVRQIFSSLDKRQAVLGPSLDGGYWGIGFKAENYRPAVFAQMPWSRPELFAATVKTLQDLDVGLLPSLNDLDTLADLKNLAKNCGPGLARRTLALIRQSLP